MTSAGHILTMASRGSSALERLRYLQGLRFSRPESPEELRLRQDEMYHLAQAVAEAYEPELQKELTQSRREVMQLLEDHKATLFGIVVGPKQKKVREERWFDHQITPEVTRDPNMAGLIVPRFLAKKVIQLHRLQISAITDLLIRGR